MIVFDQQVHSALHCAIRAVSGHDAIDHSIGTPAIVRCVVKVRSKLLDDLIQMFDSAHESIREPRNTFSVVSGKFAYASPRMTRLQRGQ
jgi:hypothetical protein